MTDLEKIKRNLEEALAELEGQIKGVTLIKQQKSSFETSSFEVGDLLQFDLEGEPVEAQCQYVDEEGADFWFTHILEEIPMNSKDTNKGGWDKTQLREYLQAEVLNAFPEEIRKRMIPIYKDDLLTLPSMEDIFGDWDYDKWEPKAAGLNNRKYILMEKVQNRCKGDWYWVRSPYYSDATHFCRVRTDGGAAIYAASRSYGLAPAFRLANRKIV